MASKLRFVALALLFFSISLNGWSQAISMTATSSNTQLFGALPTTGSATWTDNSTIASWYSSQTGTSVTANAGSSTTAGLYSYGTGTNADRTLGSINTNASGAIAYGVQLQNNSSSTITSMTVAYTGEQWRKENNATADQILFYYRVFSSAQTSMDNLATSWTAVTALNFTAPISGATAATTLDGNATANRVVISAVSIPSLSIPAGQFVVFKWIDQNVTGTDHGVGIDDVTVSWTVPVSGNNITVTQATGGTISPGTTNVPSGGSQTFTATPASCYAFSNWVVDGSNAGSSNPYTGFTNVTAPHTLTAVYTALGPNNITASSGGNGTVTPSGVTSVACGGSQTYTITPNACYSVTDVLVDGVSQGAITTYSFSNVTAPHTISATFGSSASYNIVATAGANGSISPSGTTAVPCGNTQTYTITPNACYDVANVTVDGISQGAITTYSFTNVTTTHTIAATFVIKTFGITASTGANGTVSPSGTTTVNCGSNQTYTITPNACFHVLDVLVDGGSVGAVTSYTFTNVTAAHTISASFAANGTSNIVATAGLNGSISPAGTTAVACGANQTYTITANSGYAVSTVTVDGASVGAVSTYTFTNVVAGHTISASFVQVTITTSVLIPNFICPGGSVSVPYTITNTIPSTTFSAQLSDASGFFANTTSNIIGTLISTTNGTISGTIPTSTANGTGYRIRVLTSTIVGTDNTQNITIQYSTATALGGFSTETMGAATSTTAIATYETANGFINTALTMSGTGDVRATTNSTGYSNASGGANVFITNTAGIYFQINGINTLGVSPVLMTLGVYKNSTADLGSGLGISVSSDGTTFSTPVALSAIAPLPSGSAAWSLVKLAGIIPSSSTAAIKFVQLGSSVQYRLDDINVYYGTATVPSITPNAPPSQCGGTVTLTANPNLSNAASVTWSTTATTSSIAAATTGNYSATITDGFGCVSTQGPVIVNITVPLATSVTIANSSATVCSGVSNTFTATPVNGGTPTYQWKVNGGAVGSNSASYTAAANSLGNGDAVTVDMTTSLTCVTAATVSSNPLTAQKLAYSPTAVWSETFGTSTTTSVSAYGSYSNGQGLTFSGSPSGYPEIRTTNASSGYSGFSASSNMYFATTGTAGATVVLDIAGINTTNNFPNILSFGLYNDGFALSNTSNFTVSYSTDGTNYFPLTYGPTSATLGWYLITINNALPKANNVRLRFSQSGSVQARIDDLKLTKYTVGDASITPNGTVEVCSPATQTLNALPNPGSGLTYAWSNFTSGTSVVVSSTNTLSVTLTDIFGCQSSASQLVTVNPIPSAGITGTTTGCGSVSLTATGGSTYSWSGGSSTATASNTFTTTGNYTVTVTSTAGCTATASAAVTVNPVITSAGINKVPSGTQFTGAVLTIVSTPVGGSSPYTYSWSTTPANGSISSTPVSGTMGSGTTGTFNSTVTNTSAYNIAPPSQSLVYGITVTDLNGCSISATTNVRVNPNIQAPQGSTSICQGTASSTYTTSTVMPLVTSPATSGYTGFVWSLSPAGAGSITSAGVVTWNSSFSGTASVSVFAQNTSATPAIGTQPSSTISTNVTINPTPSISVIASPASSICSGSSVTLSGAGANSYIWSSGVINATSFTPASTATYSVTGTDNNGCSATTSQTVTLTAQPTWYLDADNDGHNVGSQVACVSPGPGYNLTSTNNGDCDDNDNTKWQNLNGYVDADGDGYTIGIVVSVCSGNTLPVGYVATSLGTDCNDNDNNIHPGATDICGNTIDEDCNGSDLVCVGLNTWKGGSNVWGSASNWTIAVPTSTISGIIPTTPVSGNNFPIITSAVSINNLTVQTGATVTVNNGGVITVNGNLTNSGIMTIKNGGNFLQSNSSVYTGNGSFTVEKLVSNTANGYRDISSPVTTTVADLADDFPVFGQNGVKCWYSYNPYPNVQTYNEALSIVDGNYFEGWESRTGTSNSLPALKGIAIRTYQGAPFTLDFTGKPNNGNKSISITNTPSATTTQDGWNFVGNAYPSNIDWVTVAAMNPGITGSYYVFGTSDEYTGAWGTCNASGACTGTGALSGISRYISSGQGFFVKKSTAGTGNFVMDNSVRTATATNFYKTDALTNEIRLTITDGINNDEILTYTDVNGTNNNDQGLDAEKMAAGSTVYISYEMPDAEYAINVINEITDQTQLPLIVWVKDNGMYTISANSLNTPGLTAYLKDAITNTLYDLTTTSPSFAFVAGQTYAGRFSVVFTSSPATSLPHATEPVVKIFSSGNQIFVERVANTSASITVSNLLGQRLAEINATEAKTVITMRADEMSYVFVKVTEDNKVSTAKVLISNK